VRRTAHAASSGGSRWVRWHPLVAPPAPRRCACGCPEPGLTPRASEDGSLPHPAPRTSPFRQRPARGETEGKAGDVVVVGAGPGGPAELAVSAKAAAAVAQLAEA